MSAPVSCGIDFGTSNSTVAVAKDGDAALVALEAGKNTLPSAIFYPQKGGLLYGRQAIDAYLGYEEGRLMRGLKKILGTSLMEDKTYINGRARAFTEILQSFVARLKEQADAYAQTDITHVVMGRPVHFHDDDAEADASSQQTLENIARAVGFKDVAFLYEPIAAAFAHEAKVEGEKLALVVDLGGGTSDFTVIRMAAGNMRKADRGDDILASSGVRIGGTSFDYRLSLNNFMPYLGYGSEYRGEFDRSKILTVPATVYNQLSDWALVNFAQTDKAIRDVQAVQKTALEPDKLDLLLELQREQLGYALLEAVEKTKINLTDSQRVETHFKSLGPDMMFDIARDDFETAIAADIARIESSIAECLTKAGVEASRIELIILTGGSTELPIINHMVAKLFPHAALSKGDKLDSVGLGLAHYAANLYSA